MAELLLKLKPGSNYEDLDCLCAFSDRRIACVHAEQICFPKIEIQPGKSRLWGMNADGICPDSHPAKVFLETTQELRLERLSDTEGQIVRLSDGAVVRFVEGVPFVDHSGREGVINDLRAMTRNVRTAEHFPVFGTLNREVWYGGKINVDESRVNTIWNHIEATTPKRRADHKHWPMGDRDLKSHLALPVVAFDDDEAEKIIEPEYKRQGQKFVWSYTNKDGKDIEGIGSEDVATPPDDSHPWTLVVKSKRRNKAVNRLRIKDLLQVTDTDLDDAEKTIDKRDKEPVSDVGLLFDKVYQTDRRPFR